MAIVLNPTAGRGAAGRALPHIRKSLAERGCEEVSYYTTQARGDGYTLADRAMGEGAELVVAVGGDGTLHEVTNAILAVGGPDRILGLIPFGTGNDFARGVGLFGSLDDKVKALTAGEPHKIDVGVIEGRGLDGPKHFLVAAGVGFVADTAKTVNDGIRGLSGPAAYVYGALKTLSRFDPVDLCLAVDGGAKKALRAMFVSISNVATTGGGIKIAPDAVPDDGWLDVCLVKEMSRLRLASKLPAAFAGKHVGDPAVTMLRCREIEFSTERPCGLWIDGEVMGQTPARITLLPGALPMMLPRQPAPGKAG